jgi:Family of unknown function (DUF5719)
VLVQNPNDGGATINVTYMTPNGVVQGPTEQIGPRSRKTYNIADTVPNTDEVSTMVTADRPIIAERSMYGSGRSWATDSIGASAPQTQWYLAEGSTGPGFETWVLVQNPGEKTANVKLTYMTPSGQKTGPSLKLAPSTRTTVNLAGNIPGQWSVSTLVSSDQPVIAERAMYGNGRRWAHDSIGVSAPASTWCLAEGSTGPGFETWVLVQNPNDTEAKVSLTYMTSDVSRDGPSVVLAPHSRKTFNVADTVGQVWEVSTRVSSDKPVIAERAMYGNGRAWGTDSVGCPW